MLTVSSIEEANATIVGTTDDEVRVLLGESKGAERGSWLKADFRAIWVVKIPNVG